jgi:hypothetical protein
MHAPSRMSHTEHLCRGSSQLGMEIEWEKAAHELPPLLRYLIRIGDWFHKCFVQNSCLRYPDGAQEVDPIPKYGLLECASLVGAQNTRLRDEGLQTLSKNSSKNLPPVSRARRCTCGIAIDPQEYTARHSNLGVQQDCSHHKKRSRSCFRPPSRRKLRTSNPQMALPYLVWAGSLSACKVQVRNPGK